MLESLRRTARGMSLFTLALGAGLAQAAAHAATLVESPNWTISIHGACCESNLAASGGTTYVLAPILATGNDIFRTEDGGQNWTKVYPPVDISVPYGIEGDLHAFGDDVVYFGTQLAQGVAAVSSNRGTDWTVIEIPVAFAANDQAWAYMGPYQVDDCPVQTKPYVLMGWYRIGSVALFSCDGGLTWPIQTPLVGNNGNGPVHVVCQLEAQPGGGATVDSRIADPAFARMKAGRHGNWGPDKKLYWSEVDGSTVYVCNTDDFGVNWGGFSHQVAPGTPSGITVTMLAFDDNGTMYVMHGGFLYVSLDNGKTFSYTHALPRWGNADTGDGGSAEFFVVDDGDMYLGISEPAADNGNLVYFLRGRGVDTANPQWHEELVDIVAPIDGAPARLDFMQLVVDDNGIVTLGYTSVDGDTTTASRLAHVDDTDADGILDATDNCVNAANAGQADGDTDGVGDACDNCTVVANASQCDTNGDGFGNHCDADLNQDLFTNQADLGIFRNEFRTPSPGSDADLNCDGFVNQTDLGMFRARFRNPPGPSAFHP